mmetsp:Transcript_2168/g.4662  ORF Transcript_2168/g.4662 Transcript_2168/m.4662 type:complete len:409 (+) Transcript_2168:78-1304(+)
MPLPAWLLPSLGAALVAWIAQQKQGGIGGFFSPATNQTSASSPPLPEYAIWVVGDLHGDAECAVHWVNRTGLIGPDGKWIDPTSHLVFVGDYVDKGPTSKQVVELVKSLTDGYPSHVTALLGNHEMELLLDRDRSRWDAWGGSGFFGLAYASAHPGEYLNYIGREPTAEDEAVVNALYAASVEVYGSGMHSQVYMAPPELVGDKSILRFVPEHMHGMVTERLREYQQAYLDAYRSGTELGTWLESRPIIARLNETIFVHGGISSHGKALIEKLGVDGINTLFANNSHDGQLGSFIEQTQEGQIIYDLLTFRGNHNEGACPYLPQLLPEGVSRLGVGHTPSDSVRLMCSDNFLALDSSLGRWFRNSGNEYCPGHEVRSSNGRYTCQEINEQCEGQIVKLTAGGNVEMIQ